MYARVFRGKQINMFTQLTPKWLILIIQCPLFFLQCTVTLEITGFADKQFSVVPLAFLLLLRSFPPSRTHTDRHKVAGSPRNIKHPYTMANKQSLVDFRQPPRSAPLCSRCARASGVVVLLLLL